MVRPLPPAQKVTSTTTTTRIAGAGRDGEWKVLLDAGNEADDEGRGRMPRWMEMLPGNRRGGRGKVGERRRGERRRGERRRGERRRGVVSGGVRKGVDLERRVGSRGGVLGGRSVVG